MKALVTGGAGFIGSHICEELIRRGDYVICYDNLLTGKIENVKHLRRSRNFRFVHADVLDTEILDYYMQGVDIVFNQMASKKSVCEKSPIDDCSINAGGTLNVLLSMVRNGVKKIVHASTGSVYGEVGGQITEFTPQNPVSYYGVSKLAGEKYVAAFADLHGIQYTILRYFHVYGERQDSSSYGGVIPIFIRQALDGEPLTIHGDGEQVRSFTYVLDVVYANMYGASHLENKIYNCASGITVSVNDMADMIRNSLGDTGTLELPTLLGDVKNFDINNTLIKFDYNMNFTIFVEGLERTIEHYAALRSN